MQGGEGGDQLDGGTGREAAVERGLLVDDGQDAAGLGIDHDDGAVVGSQRVHRGAAYVQVVAIHIVAGGGIEVRYRARASRGLRVGGWFAAVIDAGGLP